MSVNTMVLMDVRFSGGERETLGRTLKLPGAPHTGLVITSLVPFADDHDARVTEVRYDARDGWYTVYLGEFDLTPDSGEDAEPLWSREALLERPGAPLAGWQVFEHEEEEDGDDDDDDDNDDAGDEEEAA
jgi:hypothetical protein